MFTSLDRNVTFEIGRNEFKSSGSVMVSLSRKWPELASVKREETRTAEMRCRRPQWPALARQLVARFTSHVGAGSRSHCLHGALPNNHTTSAAVTRWNDSSFADSRWVICPDDEHIIPISDILYTFFCSVTNWQFYVKPAVLQCCADVDHRVIRLSQVIQ